MDFVKWCSIENSYRSEHIEKMVQTYPELLDEKYVITEKLDGSNFQWAFLRDGTIRAGSRNQWLDTAGSFQGASIAQLYSHHLDLLEDFSDWARIDDVEIRLYGELFGRGILNRVDYGNDKQLRYFGLMINDKWQPFSELESAFDEFDCTNLLVPILQISDGLGEALEFETEFNSLLNDKDSNVCEGVVIAPYNNVYLDGNGSPFVLKKKNKVFFEQRPFPKALDTEVAGLNAEFKTYITENRLLSVFSKEGKIQSPKEIGKYIKLLMADAQEDFLKDNDISHLDKQQQKNVFNVGSLIADILKNYL